MAKWQKHDRFFTTSFFQDYMFSEVHRFPRNTEMEK
jgi:hypothetical protein